MMKIDIYKYREKSIQIVTVVLKAMAPNPL